MKFFTNLVKKIYPVKTNRMIVVKEIEQRINYILFDLLDNKYDWITREITKIYNFLIYNITNTFRSNCNKVLAHIDSESNLLGFAILTFNSTNKNLEVIKLYGTKEQLINHCINTYGNYYKIDVYTSNKKVSEMLIQNGFVNFVVTTHSNMGVKLFKPKIRHSTYICYQGVDIIDEIYTLLNEYNIHNLFVSTLIMETEAVEGIYSEQKNITDYNEIGGKFLLEKNKLLLPEKSIFKGIGLTVKIEPSPAIYHVHPSKFVTVDKVNRFLLAWPSGSDYVAAIYNRFIQTKEISVLNFVTSKKGIFSYQMSPMFIFFMDKVKENKNILAVAICVAVRYYFKIVEDIRITHMHIHSQYTKHVLTDMTKSIMATKRMLCDSFNIEKVIDILTCSDQKIQVFLRNTFNMYFYGDQTINVDRNNVFTQCIKQLRIISHGLNFPIIEVGNIMWEDIDLNKDKIEISMYTNEIEKDYLNKNNDTKSDFFNKIFNLENNVI